ncbi:MAG TPA: hypothetical protein PLP20_06130 [Oscillospiraceae bacterium]|nr:hypothetical protein [Oscillospiraceae bacterium]HNW05342.1 hypothetical protein [Oscillospiraceae bacterium]HPW00615.1 hypothetical protein [Oscillospiraceae bacterium]
MAKLQGRPVSGSSLFLTELIIGILFFSFAAAICVQLFVKAHLISVSGDELSAAVNIAQTAAESFSLSGDAKGTARLLDTEASSPITVGYDENWERASQDGETAYKLLIAVDESAALRSAEISVEKAGGEVIYSIRAVKYAGQ